MKDQDLNTLLDSYKVAPPGAGLASRIVAQAAVAPLGAAVVAMPQRASWTRDIWRPAAALLAASFVGFWIGFSGAVGMLPDAQDVSLYAMGYEGDAFDPAEGDGM